MAKNKSAVHLKVVASSIMCISNVKSVCTDAMKGIQI